MDLVQREEFKSQKNQKTSFCCFPKGRGSVGPQRNFVDLDKEDSIHLKYLTFLLCGK